MNPEEETDATFILGAACSLDYGYPLGDELRFDIINTCEQAITEYDYSNDRPKARLSEILKDGYSKKDLIEFKDRLKESGSKTIDDFLVHNHHIYGEITKECITLLLLHKEIKGDLYPNKVTFYTDLLTYLFPTHESILKKEISFITFNYDISLEAFLINYMKKNLALDNEESLEIYLSNIKILHVHGRITPNKEGLGRDYGKFKLTLGLVTSCSQGIKIISESNAEDKEFKLAEDLIYRAKNIFFLGFGYHSDNMEKLGLIKALKPERRNEKTIQGTTQKIDVENAIIPYLQGVKFDPSDTDIKDFLRTNQNFRRL